MSEMERNKGKLLPTGIDTENYTDDDFETLWDNGFLIVDGDVYEVKWEVKKSSGYIGFADVTENPDGSIDFHTLHYSGGGSLEEVIESKLNSKN